MKRCESAQEGYIYIYTRISVAPKAPLHSSFETGWVEPFDEFFQH